MDYSKILKMWYDRYKVGEIVDNIILIIVTLFILATILIVVVLNVLQNKRNKTLKTRLDELEVEKNLLETAPVMNELSKLESFSSNKLEVMYEDWKDRFEEIKENQIPKITELLLDADYSLTKMDYKSALYKIVKLEMEIYKVRTNTEFLMNEIKDITNGEERNRSVITKLKSEYRNLYQKFLKIQNECGEFNQNIALQFENITKRFEEFEIIMDHNEYTEVKNLTKAIEDMLKHMTVVLEEVPTIVLLAQHMLPKKIKEVEKVYQYMIKNGFSLDYLNVDYNIEEANKKINDILDRTKVLNLEDSILELKVLMDYFDSVYTDFEKEKRARDSYEEMNKTIKTKMKKLGDLINDIFSQIGDLTRLYNLSEQDLDILTSVQKELNTLNSDYKLLSEQGKEKTFAYSKLLKELEGLSKRLSELEENLDLSLSTIGNMRDDEQRARQQLDEITSILRDSQVKIRKANLPIIPKSYYVEFRETSSAIYEISKELKKKPITISTLNIRVDTARDLALKLLTRTNELIKNAKFAEISIVYGDRYRFFNSDLDRYLTAAESLFFKGDFGKSLEISVHALNKIEPNFLNKLKELEKEKLS